MAASTNLTTNGSMNGATIATIAECLLAPGFGSVILTPSVLHASPFPLFPLFSSFPLPLFPSFPFSPFFSSFSLFSPLGYWTPRPSFRGSSVHPPVPLTGKASQHLNISTSLSPPLASGSRRTRAPCHIICMHGPTAANEPEISSRWEEGMFA